MKVLEERRNIPSWLVGKLKPKFDSGSVTGQYDWLTSPGSTSPVVAPVCQLQDGSRTMTSVVQCAFRVLAYPGGKGTRYSN